MKRIRGLFTLLLVTAMVVAVSAQSTALVDRNSTQNSTHYYFYSQVDTISTSSTADTVTFTVANTFYRNMDCVISVTADSLSGGTTATATIQGATYPTALEWQTIGTAVTINGVESKSRQTVQLVDSKIRLNVLAASSTQSTAVRFEIGCKAR